MKEVMVFENEDFGKVRTVVIDNEPWFVGKDVTDILGYENGSRDINRHVDAEDRQNYQNGTFESPRGLTIINESGLYSLILGSKLPSAKKFKRWVTGVVLPCIRKNGSYSLDKQDSYMIADPVERAKRWIEEEQKRQSLESEVKELAPKAQMADDFIDAGYAITFRDVCKEIGVNERHMGKIFGLIRFAYKQGKKWRPYSETLKQGYAIVKDAYVERARQRIARMFITMDGKAYLKKMVSFYRESGLLDDWSHGINDDYDECMA